MNDRVFREADYLICFCSFDSLLELRGQIRSATAVRDALALDIAAQAQRNRC